MRGLISILPLALVLLMVSSFYGAFAEEDDQDFYEVLGIERDANEKQVKKAYRKMSLKYHPDKCSDKDAEMCNNKFQEVAQAYEVISDEELRRVYDTQGKLGLEKHAKQAQQRQQGGGNGFFGGMFGQQQREEPRGGDVRMPIKVTLEDLYNGKAVEAMIKKQTLCPKCRGSGAESPKDIQECSKCKGQGHVTKMRQIAPGFMQQVQQECNACKGRGTVTKRKCKHCNGRKTSTGTEKLHIDIERGMDSGTEIRFEHKADAHPDKRAGHVIFSIETAPHSQFERRQHDLLYDLHITLADALLGFSREIIHLDEHIVTVATNQVTRPGQVFRFQNEGMPHHDFPSTKGRLHVTIVIDFPAQLSAAQKKGFSEVFNKRGASGHSEL